MARYDDEPRRTREEQADWLVGFIFFGLIGGGIIALGVVGVIRGWTDGISGVLLMILGSAVALFGVGKAQDHI